MAAALVLEAQGWARKMTGLNGGLKVPTPKFDPTVNFGHVITSITLFITLGVGWALIDARTQQNFDAIEAVQVTVAAHSDRIRQVEIQQTRVDERYTYLQSTINDIRSGINELKSRREAPLP